MTATIINDCRDDNATGRQATRTSSLFGSHVSFIGVQNDLEASGNVIDILDAFGEEEGVILVNVAPRNGRAKKWPNGTPFGYFIYNNVLVVSSIDGLTLSLVKKFGLADNIHILDIPTVLDAAVADGRMEGEIRDHAVKGQFRSFDFVPRVAHYLKTGLAVPSENMSISDVADAPQGIVWWTDSFGNCKTTITSDEFEFEIGDLIKTSFGDIKYYNRLKDVPDNEPAIIQGSSGLGNRRLIELVVQGGSAANKFRISAGYKIL